MTNPFENADGTFVVLINDEGQHSLWPVSAATPVGWTVVHGADNRQSCLEFIDRAWTDMRPRSLAREP